MSITLPGGVTLTVEAALSAATGNYGAWDDAIWNTSTWGPDELYQDISAYFRSLATSRGFGREVATWESGSASLVLGNRDGRFSPDNLAGPYVTAGVTELRPWRPVRIRATYAGVTYPVYKGFAKDWLESWSLARVGEGDAIVTVPCADEWARLSGVDGMEVTPVGAGESYGARVHRILDAGGHSGERAVDVGSNTMQATDLAGRITSELNLVADSEGGAVWVDADGTIVAARQYALVEEPRAITSQATFGDVAPELPYSDIQVSSAGDLIINMAVYERVGGAAQTVADPTSRALYGDRRDTRTDLVCESDGQALQLASWKVARFKAPERRVTAIEVHPRRNPATLFPIVLGLKVRDQITVKRRPPGGHTITQACFVAGINHRIGPQEWVTTLDLSSASPYVTFADSLFDTALWDEAVWFF